ncbi:uncharacterized protein LOC101449436 isoform X2 [Ceratitis capitata]|uniref:uncharacterized protein LOC101449436 isoform X2 n=1 Tax=Ceratitis capitata TaxID=7213 RepID=UPI00061886DD|nr:uncharacterized protein LOC101449436 isoform X2 [Ceratitis capitata]
MAIMGGEETATETIDMVPAEKVKPSQFGEFCRRNGINPNLIMLKITLFVMYGATSSLLPYLTIHMQSIGLTVEEIAIIYLALPFTTFLSPPITGFLVDKFGKYKPVVIMSLLLNALFHHSLLFIPQQEIPGIVPSAFVMRHPDTGDIEVWWSPCPSRECPEEPELDLAVSQCVDYCLLQEQQQQQQQPSLYGPSPDYYSTTQRAPTTTSIRLPTTTTATTVTLSTTTMRTISTTAIESATAKASSISPPLDIAGDGDATSPPPPPELPLRSTTTTTTETAAAAAAAARAETAAAAAAAFTTPSSVARFQDVLNMSSTMFPPVVTSSSALSELEQGWNLEAGNDSIFNPKSWVHSDGSDSAYFMLQMHPDLADPIEQLGMEIEPDDNETVTDFKQRFGEKRLWDMQINVTDLDELDLRCGGLVRRSNMSQLTNETVNCMVQRCIFTMNAPEICPPDYKESDDRVFWIYFLLRFLATTMLSAGVTIMDPIALTMIEKYGGDFGRERLFSSIGMAIFSPITGIMIDYFSRGLGYTDYSAAFYTYDLLLVISTISVLMMPLGDKLPADNVFRDLWNLLKMPHVITFIFFLFILGNFWGFIESFLFLYLKELGAPNYLLGITITVGTVSSIPFLYGAERITRIFGHVNLIIIAFFSHAGRLVGYSFIENAWWCFPFEAMEALSCHLMWVAAATYCSILAPKSLLATLIGVLGMAHFSLGRGSGSFTGGLLIGQFGTRDAFRYMGLLAVVGGIAYGLLHLAWLRKFDHNIDDCEEEAEAMENGETEKLTEPATKEQGTSMSLERLSLMIKYNQIGSLTSLPRGSRADIHDHLSHRRSSYNVESTRVPRHGSHIGSASKVDILRSTLDINHKSSNNSVLSKADNKTSNQSLGRNRADSAPKLNHSNMKNISQPTLEGVVLEDQDTTKVIPEETDLNNSKLTVASQDEVKHNQTNGKGSSIADERNGKDDAT